MKLFQSIFLLAMLLLSITTFAQDGGDPMPVELENFEVRHSDSNLNVVHISWETAVEVNNDYFLVEHSVDKVHWTPIDKQHGKGSNSVYRSLVDVQKIANGNNFFRLVQFDKDGTRTQFEVKSLVLDKKPMLVYDLYGNEVGVFQSYSALPRNKILIVQGVKVYIE